MASTVKANLTKHTAHVLGHLHPVTEPGFCTGTSRLQDAWMQVGIHPPGSLRTENAPPKKLGEGTFPKAELG